MHAKGNSRDSGPPDEKNGGAPTPENADHHHQRQPLAKDDRHRQSSRPALREHGKSLVPCVWNHPQDTASQLKRRREGERRLTPSCDRCGARDPICCECYEPPTGRYEAAAAHLLEHGLVPAPNREGLRLMWKRGGHSRRAAQIIAGAWGLEASA